ncbi:unnamed protein product, partial [Vitis vinifera]|uniref:Uncharacterized protein n=1 Tax=Vitis vinifera TaxID=29760 RepID=D7TG65_VITVI
MVRSSQVCEDCSARWDVVDSPYWSICCSRMEFRWDSCLVALGAWNCLPDHSEPFKYHMQKFMTLIVNIMKKEKLFAS